MTFACSESDGGALELGRYRRLRREVDSCSCRSGENCQHIARSDNPLRICDSRLANWIDEGQLDLRRICLLRPAAKFFCWRLTQNCICHMFVDG